MRTGWTKVSRAGCILLGITCALAPEAAGAGRDPVSWPGSLALINVHVVTMADDQILRNQTVIIRDGRITEIGPAERVKPPGDATLVDARGGYLMPGLIDCFCHVDCVGTLIPFVANGVTTVRNTAGGHTTHLGIRDRVARGELFGPTILSTGGDITSDPPNFNGQEPVTTPEQAARVVAEVKRLGFDGVMVYSRISPEVQQAVAAAAKPLALPVTGHACLRQKIRDTVRSGQKSVDNLIGFVRLSTGEIGFPDEQARLTARTLREGGVACIPTLTVRRSRSGTRLAQPDVLRYFAPSQRGDPSEDARLRANEYRYEGAPKMVSILHREGVRILLGTDSGYTGVLPGFSMHGPFGELRNLVGAGLSPFETIKAGTRDAADFLGLLDQVGTVSVGKRADLILVEGNPLEDVANVARISGVVLRGRWLPTAELRAMLDGLAGSYRREPRRFAELPPLPSDGEEEFSARYELRRDGLVIGEERLAIHRLGDGRLVLDSQASLDPYFDTRTTLRAELGTASRGEMVAIVRQAADGTASLTMRRSGDKARISGARPYYGRIELEEPLDPGAVLGGPMLANYVGTDMVATFVVAAGALSGLETGAARELRLKQLELNPEEFLRNATVGDRTWSVVRKDDVATGGDGDRRDGRSYEITTAGRAGTGSYKMTLIVDRHQRPWRMVVQTDGGEDSLQRV